MPTDVLSVLVVVRHEMLLKARNNIINGFFQSAMCVDLIGEEGENRERISVCVFIQSVQ